MRKISFVYFDVGGVVVRDFSKSNKWREMKSDMGISAKQDKEFDDCYDVFEDEVNLGKDVDLFVPALKDKFGAKLPEGYSMLSDFVNRFEKNEGILILARKLKKSGIRIGLLTNIYPKMLKMISEKGLLENSEWDMVIDSSVEGVKKPDPKIFELARKRVNVPVEEILFIDNKQKYIDVVKGLGWRGFYYDSADYKKSTQELESFLRDEGVIN